MINQKRGDKEKYYQIVKHKGQTPSGAKRLLRSRKEYTGASRLYWSLLSEYQYGSFPESKLRNIIQCTPNAVPVRASCMPYDSYRPTFQDQVDFMIKHHLIKEEYSCE